MTTGRGMNGIEGFLPCPFSSSSFLTMFSSECGCGSGELINHGVSSLLTGEKKKRYRYGNSFGGFFFFVMCSVPTLSNPYVSPLPKVRLTKMGKSGNEKGHDFLV